MMKQLVFFLGIIFWGCVTSAPYTPPPDPFSGTWFDVNSSRYMHIIEEVIPSVSWKGTFYVRTDHTNWVIYAEYTIEAIEVEGEVVYVNDKNWWMSIEDDVLNVGNMLYERVK